MRALLVNVAMAGRNGAEVVTAETASGLRARGVDVRVYARRLGPAADSLRRLGVPVTDDLAFADWTPDVIQANQTAPLLPVIARFPSVPVVTICHDATVWLDEAIELPQIRRRLAVDRACRDRVSSAVRHEDRVAILPNAVDLHRFRKRAPLPARPQRALVLTKHANHIPQIGKACADAGIALDMLGPGVGCEVDDLPSRLPAYDLVFATARMALEAMAVGCAAIVCDGRGLAGMVTTSVVRPWRMDNFGLRLLVEELSPGTLGREIGRYDASDAAAVCDFIRQDSCLQGYLDRLESIHREVLSEGPVPLSPDLLRLIDGCCRLLDRAEGHFSKTTAEWEQLYRECRDWNAELQAATSEYKRQLSEYRDYCGKLEDRNGGLKDENRLLSSELEKSASYIADQKAEIARLQTEWEQLYRECRNWNAELQASISEYKRQVSDYQDHCEKLVDWNGELRRALDCSKDENRLLSSELERSASYIADLERYRDLQTAEIARLQTELLNSAAYIRKLLEYRDRLKAEMRSAAQPDADSSDPAKID